jgi:hypothetical protein
MGCFCWSRTESVFFVPYAAGVVLAVGEGSVPGRIRRAVLFVLPAAIAFLVWHGLYITLVLGGGPGGQMRAGIPGSAQAWGILGTMAALLEDTALYGSLIYLFLLVLVLELAVFRSARGLPMAGWLGYLFVAFILVVAWFPAASVEFTVKRGFLKLLPVMVFYMGQSRALAVLSERVAAWEGGTMRGSPKARIG